MINKHKYKKIHSVKKTRKAKSLSKFIKLKCHPKSTKKHTCYNDKEILKLKQIWNEKHPDKKITTTNTNDIWMILKDYYKNICNKESCWVKQLISNKELSNELLNSSFAPEAPSSWLTNPNEWLSSVDIVKVMTQYETKYKCFEFIGPSPIDYDTKKLYTSCVWDELCKFDLKDHINKGKTKIGIIFNTDPHTKSGSHWISLFININKAQIFFFDSVGQKIPAQIHKFTTNVVAQGKKLKNPINFTFDENYPIEHQYGDTECGMYSLYFIIHMLEDKITGHYLKTHILKDIYVEKFRNIYFNKQL